MVHSFRFLKRVSASVIILGALAACGGSGGVNSSPMASSPPPPPPPPPPPASTEITLTGIAAKGIVSNGTVLVLDLANPLPLLDPTEDDIIATGSMTDSNGEYTITIDENASQALVGPLLVGVSLDNAGMVCDAFGGCGTDSTGNQVDFGDVFEIGDSTSLLAAIVDAPATGSTLNVNLNTLTTLQFARMIGLTIDNNLVDSTDPENPIFSFRAQDVLTSQDFIANVFGLESQDYSTLPFVDVMQPFDAAADQQAIRASVLGAGILTAGVANAGELPFVPDFDDVFDPIFNSFVAATDANGNVLGPIVREDEFAPFFGVTSLQEMIGGAILIASLQTDQTSSAFMQLETYLVEQATRVNSAPVGLSVASDGSIPELFTDLSFVEDSVTIGLVESSVVAEIVNPSNLNFQVSDNSDIFEVFLSGNGPNFVEIIQVNGVPSDNGERSGTFTIEVDFFTNEFGEMMALSSDTIDVIFEEAVLTVVNNSATISRADAQAGNGAAVFQLSGNQDLIAIQATVTSANASEFSALVTSDTSFEVTLTDFTLPNGVYNVTVDIETGLSTVQTVDVEITVTD